MEKAELLRKNCERWSLFHQDAARKLAGLDCKHVAFTTNPNGSANLKVAIGGEDHYFHSQENPVDEAALWFSKAGLHGIKVLFIYGVGLGYFYDAAKVWLEGDEGRSLVFLEDDLEVLYHLFQTERGQEMLNNKQVVIAFLDQQGSILSQLATIFVLKPFKVLALDLYAKTRGPTVEQIRAKFSFYMNLKLAATMEYSDHGRNFFTNYFRNLLLMPEAALGNDMFGKFAGVPAIICGAGPSLAKNVHLLSSLRDRALIFAGGTAMNALNAVGFLPHFGVGIDPNPAQYTRLIMNQAFEIPYFYRNRLLHQALKLIHGKHLYVTGTGGYPVSKWFEEKAGMKEAKEIEEGCNVINFSLSIAQELGCNPIILVGVDLAYTNEKSYAPGIHHHPIHLRKEYFGTKSAEEDAVVKMDIYGQPTFTLWKWVAESLWFSNYARLCGNRTIINATEGGIGFFTIPNYTLAEIADNFLQRQYDFDGMVHGGIAGAPMPQETTRQTIEEGMKEFLKSLDRCENLCRLVQKDCEETERKFRFDMDAPPLSETGLKALVELEQEPAYTYLLKVFSESHQQLQAHDWENLKYQGLELGGKEIEIKKASLNAQRYTFLRETAKVNKNILETVLKEEADRQLQLLMRAETAQALPSPSLTEGTYLFEAGTIIIDDPELDLHIKEPFQPDPENIFRDHYPNGQMAVEQYYLDGSLHGPSTYFSETGGVLSRHWFIKGKREGKAFSYYPKGAIQSIQRYRNGLWHGRHETFYPDGKLKAVIPYSQGQIDGEVNLYYPTGELKRQLHFVEGTRHGVEKIWNETGLLTIEAEFDHDKPVGTARQWYSNGNMALEIVYEKDPRNFMIRQWDEAGFPSVTERRVTGDYFDQVALQTNKLTDTINQVLQQVDMLGPLVEKVAHKTSQEVPQLSTSPEMHPETAPLETIRKEMEHLKSISEELLKESGMKEDEEMFWKGPSARRDVEDQVQTMATHISKEINAIQNGLVMTLGLLAKKLQPLEEKQSDDKQRDEKQVEEKPKNE
ncbi:MAG: DUF115 domain-containing protein [Parachlamydia sp.]|nr:DUF115 domain-containing protein [Parachlamydia sp.]